MKRFYRITAPHFVAGVEYDRDLDRIVRAAPIVRYTRGWSWAKFLRYSVKRSWKLELLLG